MNYQKKKPKTKISNFFKKILYYLKKKELRKLFK